MDQGVQAMSAPTEDKENRANVDANAQGDKVRNLTEASTLGSLRGSSHKDANGNVIGTCSAYRVDGP